MIDGGWFECGQRRDDGYWDSNLRYRLKGLDLRR